MCICVKFKKCFVKINLFVYVLYVYSICKFVMKVYCFLFICGFWLWFFFYIDN